MLNGNRTKSERGRAPRDLYITPLELANAAIERLFTDEKEFDPLGGLDAGCGTGVWGEAVDFLWSMDGIDICPKVEGQIYHAIITGDFLKYDKKIYNFIFGNPPYSLAEEFIRHSFDLLMDNGYTYFLLRLSFLEGMARGKGLFQEFPIKRVYVCSRRPSFFSTNGRHTTDTLAYAMFLWQKGYAGKTKLSFLDWDYNK